MKKADSFIVTVDKEKEIHVIDNLELQKYAADKAEIDHGTGSKQTPQKALKFGNQVLEPKYNPQHLVDLLDLYTYHESCVDAVATDASGISYTFDPVEGMVQNEPEKEKFKEILDRCTPSINAHLYRCIYDRRSIGYGAIEVIRWGNSNSEIRRLKHIPSHTLRRHTDEKRVLHMADDGTRVWYVIYGKNYNEKGEYCDVHADTGEWFPLNSLPEDKRANELLWTMEYAPGTNYYGRPPIIGALPSIKGDLSAVAYNTQFFENYGMPAFAVTVTGDFQDYTEEEFITNDKGEKIPNPDYDVTQTLRYKISQQIKEIIKHPHSALCITIPTETEDGNVEVKITPLSVKTEEGHFRMYRKDVRDQTIHSHKVDPSRMGIFDSGNLNGTNSDNTKSSYKYGTVAPIKAEIESMINLIGAELNVRSWVFRINDVDPIDYTKDIQLADFLFARGAMTIRDLVHNFGDKFGLNIDDVDDMYLDARYMNGVPLEQLWNTVENNPYLEVDSILEALDTNLNEANNEEEFTTSDAGEETDTGIPS